MLNLFETASSELNTVEAFDIQSTRILSTANCFITIQRSDYREQDIVETATKIIAPGALTFVFPDQNAISHLTYPYPIHIKKTKVVEDDDDVITIHYKDGDIIAEQEYADSGFNMGNVVAMIQGRVNYIDDPKTLVMMLHSQLPKPDLMHLELLVANMMYNRKTGKQCRFSGNYKNAETKSQMQITFGNSWLSSLSYRNIDKAVNSGLIGGKNIEENPIENIINENYK